MIIPNTRYNAREKVQLVKILVFIYPIKIFEVIVTFDFIELEIKQAASDFCNTLSALSRSFSSEIVTVGSSIISLIINLPSICSNLPFDLQLKWVKFNFEFSAMDKKVVIKQLLTAAVNK